MKKIFTILILALLTNLSFSQIVPTDGYVYVKADGTGNGSSWANATSDLQGAIDANGVARVWIAEGTYYPTWHWDAGDPRAFSFKMKNGVVILGGFPNTGDPVLSDRNFSIYKVNLSGDIGSPSDISDNAYHVIYNVDSLNLNQTAYINGVYIQYGNADGTTGDNYRGGGVFNSLCSPRFYNCYIIYNEGKRGAGMYNNFCSPDVLVSDIWENHASEIGGGILNSNGASPTIMSSFVYLNTAVENGAGIANVDNCNPQIINSKLINNECDGDGGGILNSDSSNPFIESCEISSNNAVGYGGGILNDNSSPVIINCIISNNNADLAGGGILNNADSHPSIINNTIVYNTAGLAGAGMANNNSSPDMTNCILWNNSSAIFNQGTCNPLINYSCIQGGYAGTGNISDDPLLRSNISPYYQLNFNSPAINAGINDSVPDDILEDYYVNDRIIDDVVDMGAYESRGIIYVNQSAVGSNDGFEWYNAYLSLESALAVAQPGNKIWVADGIYIPSNENGLGTGDRYQTFKLKPGVQILGGFTGSESDEEDRNWITNQTILEGNLGTEKVYHVVYAGSDCNEETILDGFTIRNGQAGGANSDFRSGANVYINGSSPVFKNCNIHSGSCGNFGANVYMINSNSVFDDCYINSGNSDNLGGGIACVNSSAKFNYCQISDNYAYGAGGAVTIEGQGINVFNSCSFTENAADDSGSGGVFYIAADADTVLIVNSFMYDNAADVTGGALDIAGKTIIVNSTIGYGSVNDPGAAGGNLYLRATADVEIYNSVIFGGYADVEPQIFVVTGAQLSVSHSILETCGDSGDGWNSYFGTDLGGNIDFNNYWWNYNDAINNNWPGIDGGTTEPYGTIAELENIFLDADKNPRLRGVEIDMGHLEIPYCWLQTFLSPAEVVENAEWSYDGGVNWSLSGDGFWKTPETITVEFSTVDGYTTPDPVSVTMDWAEDYIIYGEYVIISNSESLKKIKISAYPNPASDIIFVESENVNPDSQILLLSADGKILEKQSMTGLNVFNLGDLPAGMYFIKTTEETIKIIKQ